MPIQPHKPDCNTVHALEKPCPKPCDHDWVKVSLGAEGLLEGLLCTRGCYSIKEVRFTGERHADKS